MKQTLSSGRVKLSLATGLLYIFCLFQLVYSASNDTGMAGYLALLLYLVCLIILCF